MSEEYLTANAGVAYPFIEGADGLEYVDPPAHGVAATLPPGIFADALVSLPRGITGVFLSDISDTGGQYQITLKDSDGNVVIQDILDISVFGADYYTRFVLEASGSSAAAVCVVVTEAFTGYLAATTADSFQERLAFETRAINHLATGIQSLDLYEELPDPPQPDTPGPITDDVILFGGYNVTVPAEATGSDITELDLSAVPGTGAGLVPCDEAAGSEFVRRPMHLVPDENGNIQLTAGAEECYGIAPLPSIDSFQVQGNCVACCSCEDYTNTATSLRSLLTHSETILNTLNDARNTHYEPGVTHFNQSIAPNYIGVKLQVNGVGGAALGGDPDIASGASNWATITAIVKNKGDYTISARNAVVTMTTPVVFAIRQAAWEYDSSGGQIAEDDITGSGVAQTLDLSGVPDILRGKQFSLYLNVYVPGGFHTDPDWAGQVIFRFIEKNPAGDIYTDVTDTVEFT